MAQRRMFNKAITESDRFMCLPHSAQSLYFHLCMNADDDGFVGNPNTIVRITAAEKTDLEWLVSNGYVIGFKSGIVAIRHWKLNNYLRSDRYLSTIYKDEKSLLSVDSEGIYMLPDEMIPAAEVMKDESGMQPLEMSSPSPSRQKTNIKTTTKKIEKTKTNGCMLEVFETLWKNYPVKDAREKAYRTFEHKVRGLNEEEIRNTGNEIWVRLVASIKTWKEKELDIKYIPYFGKWLDDEIPNSAAYNMGKKG